MFATELVLLEAVSGLCRLPFGSCWFWWPPKSNAGVAPTRGEVSVSSGEAGVELTPTSGVGFFESYMGETGGWACASRWKITWARIGASSVGRVFLLQLVMPLEPARLQVQDHGLDQDRGPWGTWLVYTSEVQPLVHRWRDLRNFQASICLQSEAVQCVQHSTTLGMSGTTHPGYPRF